MKMKNINLKLEEVKLQEINQKQNEKVVSKENVVETRLYSSLQGEFVDSEGDSSFLDAYGLLGYDYTIRKALKNDWIREHETGLAEFLEIELLKDKIVSMYPSVEVWDYQLWGVLEVKSKGELDQDEIDIIKREWRGQMTDGWGEGFFQDEIDCDEGCNLFVDFGAASCRGVFTESELKGNIMEQEKTKIQGMDGIS
ncbi:hypothetical protein [Hungatella hathewayi]